MLGVPSVAALAIYASSFCRVSSLTSWSVPHRPVHRASFRQLLANDGDAQYSATIVIGGQPMQALLDTGSFELVVFSQLCDTCGDRDLLYDGNRSASASHGELVAEQAYGSGTTRSLLSWDSVRIGQIDIAEQMFWQVQDAEMPILHHASFQAILGIGPPSSALKVAKDEVMLARQEVDSAWSKAEWEKLVEHYESIQDVVSSERAVIQHANVHVMSVCLQRERLSPGVVVWNDADPRRLPAGLVTEVPIYGETYWSALLGDVRLGDVPLGCQNEHCVAVLDSGTSLLAAPPTAVQKISEQIQQFSRSVGGCSNISSLPELSFTLGGQRFSLPPESYAGELTGEPLEELEGIMPHISWPWSLKRKPSEPRCEALLMSMEPQEPGQDSTWILGLPLFRKYYTSFVFTGDFTADRMFLSEATDNCHSPGSEEFHRARKSPAQRTRTHMKVDAAKLRAPHKRTGRRARIANQRRKALLRTSEAGVKHQAP